MNHEQQQAKRDLSVMDETELLNLHRELIRRSQLAELAGNVEEWVRLGNECKAVQIALINQRLFNPKF